MRTLFEDNKPSVADKYKADFQTPVPVAKYMASMIPKSTKTVLEPTPGIGNIVSQLTSYDVTAPDDYFLLDKSRRWDCIVMNPPFSSKYAFLEHAPAQYIDGMRLGYLILRECMRMSNDVIALMPWFTISDSDTRLRFLKRYGIVSITALPRKTFQYARIQTCVLQLSKGYSGPTEFKTFNF